MSNGRQLWRIGRIYVPYLRCVQRIQGTKEGGKGRRRGGTKKQRKNKFRTPWKICGKLKRGGAVDTWECSRTVTGRERKYGWVIGILGRKRSAIRWMNALVWQTEMLERRQGTPWWEDEALWWIWRGLGKLEGLGSIHNNERQILGFEQSLTDAWKNTS